MLPYSKHPPSRFLQLTIYGPVAFAVRVKLQLPEFFILTGGLIAARTPVPKAAIHKYGYSFLIKDEIRTPNQWLMSTPSLDSMLTHNTNERLLGALVASRTNTRHYF